MCIIYFMYPVCISRSPLSAGFCTTNSSSVLFVHRLRSGLGFNKNFIFLFPTMHYGLQFKYKVSAADAARSLKRAQALNTNGGF